jgi:hypothetical protein
MSDFYYSGVSCVDSTTVAVLSSTTEYNIGDVVGFSIEGEVGCFTITSLANSGDTVDLSIVTGYTDCISCFQDVGGVFIFSVCSDPESAVFVDVNEFNTVPSFLQSYYLELPRSTGCYVFVGWFPLLEVLNESRDPLEVPNESRGPLEVPNESGDPFPVPNEFIPLILGPYEECNVCEGYNIPTSANTAYTLCTTGCDGKPVELEFPHPVYTNNYGNAVTQLNAVQLGGPNGLNN